MSIQQISSFLVIDKRYPGSPDIVLPKYRTIVFIHGCFWHHHEGCKYALIPKSTLISGGQTYNLISGSDGIASVTLTVGEIGSTFQGTVYAGKDDYSWSFDVPAFPEFNDYAWDYNTGSYNIVKYPTGITHTFEVVEVSYNEYYNLSKQTVSSSVVMAIPKVYADGIDADNGIHMEAAVIQKKDSNQGWGDAIGLVSSKSLNHYRDTKILELGAYPGKKGLKYSNSDHVTRDVNVTTGQLSLDSQKYYFNLWFENGYVKATITHGTATDFTYERYIGDKITFDTFYPAIMIYDAGGHIQWENVSVEPWTREE